MRAGLGWSEREVAAMVEGFARLADVRFVPDDRAAADRALASGASLVEIADSDAARALAAVADALVPPPAHRRTERRRLLARRR
jgi:hypothetical protein